MSNINNWGKFFFLLFFSPGYSALFPFVLFYFKAVHSLINVRARIAKYIVWQIRYYILVKDRQSLIKLKYYGNLYPGGKGDRVHLISFIVKEKSKQTNKQNRRSRKQILVGFFIDCDRSPFRNPLDCWVPAAVNTVQSYPHKGHCYKDNTDSYQPPCPKQCMLSLSFFTFFRNTDAVNFFLPSLPPSLSLSLP